MNKIRIKVEPVSNKIYDDSTQNYFWMLQEYSTGRFRDGILSWRETEDWERPLKELEYSCNIWWDRYHKFSGYCGTKEEGIIKAKQAAKEYCRQRENYKKNKEYIRNNTHIEELSCENS